jgi:hypothetical protein
MLGAFMFFMSGIGLLFLADRFKSDVMGGVGGISAIVGAIGILLGIAFSMITYSEHADDLATLRGQHEVIAIYEARRDRLNQTLAEFEYPKGALLNADSPVRAIAESLSVTENMIADSEKELAKTRIRIEARKLGLFGYIVTWMGDK